MNRFIILFSFCISFSFLTEKDDIRFIKKIIKKNDFNTRLAFVGTIKQLLHADSIALYMNLETIVIIRADSLGLKCFETDFVFRDRHKFSLAETNLCTRGSPITTTLYARSNMYKMVFDKSNIILDRYDGKKITLKVVDITFFDEEFRPTTSKSNKAKISCIRLYD